MTKIDIDVYNKSYKSQWNQVIRNSKNPHFFFFRDYIEYHQDRFKEHSLIIKRDGKIVGIFPGNVSDGVLYSYQGLTFGGMIVTDKVRVNDCEVILKKINDHLRSIGISKVIYKKMPYIYNQVPFDEDVYFLIKNGGNVSYSEIGQVIDYTHYKISSSRKNEIKNAVKNKLRISKESDFREFWEVLKKNLEKHGAAPTHSLEEIEYLAKKFPKHIELYCIKKGYRVLCGTVLFINKKVVHTQYIGSSEEAHQYYALEYLLSELINKFTEKRYFSFGTSTELKGNKLNKGLAFFKEAFGARGIANNVYQIDLE